MLLIHRTFPTKGQPPIDPGGNGTSEREASAPEFGYNKLLIRRRCKMKAVAVTTKAAADLMVVAVTGTATEECKAVVEVNRADFSTPVAGITDDDAVFHSFACCVTTEIAGFAVKAETLFQQNKQQKTTTRATGLFKAKRGRLGMVVTNLW